MLRLRRSSPPRRPPRLAQSGVGSGAQAAGDDGDAKLAGNAARSDVGSDTKAERRKVARRRSSNSAAPA
jgi:hypothetical protein